MSLRDERGNIVDGNGTAWYPAAGPGWTSDWTQSKAYDGGPPPRVLTQSEIVQMDLDDLI